MQDEDLYRNLPDDDKMVLSSYLEGDDKNGQPYFSRLEKTEFLRKWKEKFDVQESINLNEGIYINLNSKQLNESFLVTFGAMLMSLLERIFGMSSVPVSIKGTPSQIKNFANVLSKETSYLKSFQENGLDNPSTYRIKSQLQQAISKFERATGIKWPFKK